MNPSALHRTAPFQQVLQTTLILATGTGLLASPPELNLRDRDGRFELTWAASNLGYRVESSATQLDSPDWRPIQEAAIKVDGEYRLGIPRDSAMGFYRLVQVAAADSIDQPGDFADSNGDGIDGDFTRAVFLAPPPFGNDRNLGTAELPVATLRQAVELAESIPLRHDVYMAQGTYVLGSTLRLPPRVSLFGQFDGTTNWGRADRYRTLIQGPSTTLILGDYAGEVLHSDNTVRLVGLEVTAADATLPGESSRAVMVRNLPTNAVVSIEGCRITAGDGASPGGSSYGVLIANLPTNGAMARLTGCWIVAGNGAPGSAGRDGGDGPAGAGGASGRAGSANGIGGAGGVGAGGSQGGAGGKGGSGAAGSAGNGGEGDLGGLAGLGGSAKNGCRQGFTGLDAGSGDPGSAGKHGAAAEEVWGELTEAGYVALVGRDGLTGRAGGGGGGGGGGGSNFSEFVANCPPDQAGGGGGGGGGGLPGGAGAGGGSGGSSIAVYSFSSTVTVLDSELVAGNGGDGGQGGNGGIGGLGGAGGAGGAINHYGALGGGGGTGGIGGASGAGAGGPGGHSFGFLFDYDPTLKNVGMGNTYRNGFPGLGGAGGITARLGAAPEGPLGFVLAVGSREVRVP